MDKLFNEELYLGLMDAIVNDGYLKGDRTGVGTQSLHGKHLRMDLTGNRIPLLTTKEMLYRSLVIELEWFLSGSTNVKFLKDNNVSIWDDWVIPSTAVFEDCDNPTGQDMLTWLRCYHPGNYNLWKKYKADNKLGQPKREQVKAFYDTIGLAVANRKLVSGSIGEGAYGSAWRNWEDTRIIHRYELDEYRARGFEINGVLSCNTRFVMTRKIDQIYNLIEMIRKNPDSRRHIVSAWNPVKIDEAVLPACHSFFQLILRDLTIEERFALVPNGDSHQVLFNAENLDALKIPKKAITLMLHQRSGDYPVGVPFNLAQYAILAHLVAHVTGNVAECLVWNCGDAHVYTDQIELCYEQLSREPMDNNATVMFPSELKEIDDFKFEHAIIKGYDEFHPRINYPVSV